MWTSYFIFEVVILVNVFLDVYNNDHWTEK